MKYVYLFVLLLVLTTKGSTQNISREECPTFTFKMEKPSQKKMEKASFHLLKEAILYAKKSHREKAYKKYYQSLLSIEVFKKCFNFKDIYFTKSFIELEVGKLYDNNNPSFALTYYNKVIEIEKNNSIDSTNPIINFRVKKSRSILLQVAYLKIGYIFLTNEENKKALNYFKKSLEVIDFSSITSPKDNKIVASLYNNIGTIYGEEEEVSRGLIYFNKALPFALKANDKKLLMYIYNNIALTAMDKKDINYSITTLKDTIKTLKLDKSIKWVEKKDIFFYYIII